MRTVNAERQGAVITLRRNQNFEVKDSDGFTILRVRESDGEILARRGISRLT